jgi:hypothetical protein
MLTMLAAITLVLTALDHWTTYLCLTQHVPGWRISEGNPLAAWLFSSVGLVPGLAIDTAITLCAVGMLVRTGLLPRGAKGACLLLLVTTTGVAVLNNFGAIHTLGIPPLGRG